MTDNKVADIKAPHAVATTTAPSGTFKEVKVSPGDGVLMYWPEQNAFLALFADEYREFYAEADQHSKAIDKLQAANRKVTEASIALREAHKSAIAADIKKADASLETALNELHQASAAVKKKLQPLSKMDAKGGVKMVELVSLRTPKYKAKAVPIYVKSTMLTKILAEKRIHVLSNEKGKRPEEKIFKNGQLDTKEIGKRIAAKVQDQGFQKKWKIKPDDADAYTGVLSEWAEIMNADIATFLERAMDDVEKNFNVDAKDSRRNIDLSCDAQLMRYTAGAGLEVNFNPFRGNLYDKRDDTWHKRVKRGIKSGELGVKANANASFAIAEGRIRTQLYFPHYAGWHANPVIGGETFEFGYWRLYGDIILSGTVGASLAVELDIGMSYTGGKQGIRGIPPEQKNKGAVKVRGGAGAELNAFAGARTGLDLNGALQWLNPEGDEGAAKAGKARTGQTIPEFKDIAKVSAGVGVAGGIGAKGALAFKHAEGKFIVYAKLGACLGVGADAVCKFEAGYDTIRELFKCIAYQLKRADFHKISDAITTDAYEAFSKINYLIVAKGRNVADYANKPVEAIDREFTAATAPISATIAQGGQEGWSFLRHMRAELEKQTGSWLTYVPPEVLGQLLRHIAAARHSADSTIREIAPSLLDMLLGAAQTFNHLNTIAERMTPVMGDKQSARTGFAMMEACVAGTIFAPCVDQAKQRLALAQPVFSAPFIWNTEPKFVITTLAIEHPMYA